MKQRRPNIVSPEEEWGNCPNRPEVRAPSEYLEVVVSLFTVSSPLAVAPVFLALTAGYEKSRRTRNAMMAAGTLVVVCLVALFVGEPLFHTFSIGIPSFRVAGGLLLLLNGLSMVRDGAGDPNVAAPPEGDVGVVPVGLPLLAGPGTISTMIIQSQEAQSGVDDALLCLCVTAVGALALVCLLGAQRLSLVLGKRGLDVLTRIFGLVLAALATEFIASGLRDLFPVLQ